jgi:hypothetical protein
MDTYKALHTWTDRQLADRFRDYPTGNDPIHGANLGAEIARRRALRTERRALTGIVIAAAAAFFSMCAAVASWFTIYMKLG